VREDGHWMLRRTHRHITDEELHAWLESTPGRFSPNVLLRPVVESSILPTLAYVGGPAEVSYFAQIGCLFEAHGVEAPLVFPRFSVTLVEGKVRRVLDKFGLEVDDLHRPFHELAAHVLARDLPVEVTASADALRAAIQAGYERLSAAATAIDPTLEGWLDGVRNSALSGADNASRKITAHHRKRHETELEQLRKAANNLYPGGAPQERVLNVLPYLSRYGIPLLLEVLEAMHFEWSAGQPAWTGVQCNG
jgi:uncharacterized protein YllA (UPF0747 family)